MNTANKNKVLRSYIISFLICYIIFILTESLYRTVPWRYDTGDYWSRGETLVKNGFLLNSIDGFRGYVYPLYLAVINRIGNKMAWYVMNPAIISVMLLYIISKNFECRKEKEFITKVTVAAVLFCILFTGNIAFPLSDMLPLLCICIALTFLSEGTQEKGKKKFVYSLGAGAFAYFSYNIRTIYLFAILGLLILCVAMNIKNNKNRHTIENIIVEFAGIALGILAAGIPQAVMNYKNLGSLSIGVPTNGLMLQQMFWGIKYQRYDTYMPRITDAAHPNPQIYFTDAAGLKILEEMNLDSFSTWGDFFRLFIHHPIDVAAIYIRHFINFIFPCWPEVYVRNLNSSKWLLGVIGFSTLFISVLSIVLNSCKSWKTLGRLTPVLVPSILIIPGAVEYRFSIGIYFYFIMNLCFNIDWKGFVLKIKENWWKILLVYIIILGLCLAIWSSMLSGEAITPLTF